MSDKDEQNKPEETTEGEQPKDDSQQEQPAGEQPKDKPKEGSEEEGSEEEPKPEGEDEEGEELDLDRAKAKIAKANDEAKNLRTRLREAEDKLKDAKTPEEVDAIVQQMTKDREDAEHALLVENVALKFKLPEKAQKRLAGTTREELEADAKELADLFGADEDDEDLTLEGGLNPRERGEEASDPRSLAQKHGSRKRAR